jgi:hypothetical protein
VSKRFWPAVRHRHGDALFREHRVHLGLEPRSQRHEFCSVPDDLPQLAESRWRDVGLGEPSQAQQIDEVLRVALVVLHPPVAPVVAERVGEVQVGAHLLQEIGEPIPSITSFENDLGMLAGLRELLREGLPAVVQMDRLEDRACCVFVDNHRSAPMEVDADVALLLFHGISPSS